MEHWIKWWYTSGTRTQKEHWVKNCPGLFNFLLFTFLHSWVVEYIPKWNNMNLFYVWVPIYGAFQFLSDRGFTIFWFAVLYHVIGSNPQSVLYSFYFQCQNCSKPFSIAQLDDEQNHKYCVFCRLEHPSEFSASPIDFNMWSLVNHEMKQ